MKGQPTSRRRKDCWSPTSAPSATREPDTTSTALHRLEHPRQRAQRGRAVGVAEQPQLAAGFEHPAPHREALAAVHVVAQQAHARVRPAAAGRTSTVRSSLALSTTMISYGPPERLQPLVQGADRRGDPRLLVVGRHDDRHPWRAHASKVPVVGRMFAPPGAPAGATRRRPRPPASARASRAHDPAGAPARRLVGELHPVGAGGHRHAPHQVVRRGASAPRGRRRAPSSPGTSCRSARAAPARAAAVRTLTSLVAVGGDARAARRAAARSAPSAQARRACARSPPRRAPGSRRR